MTSPPQEITIECPSCGKEFQTWWRPSINLQLVDFDEDYLREATVKTCPNCKAEVRLDALIVDEEGNWHVGEAPNNMPNDRIRALLRFLPLFESEGFSLGQIEAPEGSFPDFAFTAEGEAFLESIYDNGWVMDFDWPRWQGQAKKYVQSPDRLQTARIGTIRKLLTTHVRKDRFCAGHLNAMFENGHLTAILRRLKNILDSGRGR